MADPFTLWYLGGLIFWPVARLVARRETPIVRALRIIFVVQCVLCSIGFAYVWWAKRAGHQDWLHALILPCLVNFISVAASMVVLMDTAMGERR